MTKQPSAPFEASEIEQSVIDRREAIDIAHEQLIEDVANYVIKQAERGKDDIPARRKRFGGRHMLGGTFVDEDDSLKDAVIEKVSAAGITTSAWDSDEFSSAGTYFTVTGAPDNPKAQSKLEQRRQKSARERELYKTKIAKGVAKYIVERVDEGVTGGIGVFTHPPHRSANYFKLDEDVLEKVQENLQPSGLTVVQYPDPEYHTGSIANFAVTEANGTPIKPSGSYLTYLMSEAMKIDEKRASETHDNQS